MSGEGRESNQEGDSGKKRNDGGGKENILDATKDLFRNKRFERLKERDEGLARITKHLSEIPDNRFADEENKIAQWESVDPNHIERVQIAQDQMAAIAFLSNSQRSVFRLIMEYEAKKEEKIYKSHPILRSSSKAVRFSSSAMKALEDLFTDSERLQTSLAKCQQQEWEDLGNRLRETREQAPRSPGPDIARWERTGFPGDGWHGKGFSPREGLNIPELNLDDHQLRIIHPQIRALEEAEEALRSAELQYTTFASSCKIPEGFNNVFLTYQVAPAEKAYKEAFSAVRNAVLAEKAYKETLIAVRNAVLAEIDWNI